MLANRHHPQLMPYDRWGNRVDEVEFHPSWHWLMERAVGQGLAAAPWESDSTHAHVRRAAGFTGDIAYVITGVGVAAPGAYPSAASAALLAKLKRLAITAAAAAALRWLRTCALVTSAIGATGTRSTTSSVQRSPFNHVAG